VSRAGEVGLLDSGFVKPGFGGPQLSHAFSFQFEAVGAVHQPVQYSVGDGGITDHRMMPQKLTGESLRSGSLIRIILCMAGASGSAIVDQDAGLI
jgi:hypothetical protein